MLAAFDLDGTLVDQAGAARAWTAEFVQQWDLPVDAVERIAAQLSERRPKGPLFDDLVGELSLPTTGDLVAADYRSRMPELVQCGDDVKAALRRLREAGWAVGIVTNGSVANQEGKIRATGLSDLVDGWAISDAVGFRKPDRAIFRALSDLLQVNLDGWMVGDGVEHDIVGGAAAGLSTILLAATRPSEPPLAEPTRYAASVTEAVDLILSPGDA